MDAHEVKGSVKELEGLGEKTYGKAREKVKEVAQKWDDQNQDLVSESESTFMNWVRDYPGTAIGGALLIGFLTASLLGSRRH